MDALQKNLGGQNFDVNRKTEQKKGDKKNGDVGNRVDQASSETANSEALQEDFKEFLKSPFTDSSITLQSESCDSFQKRFGHSQKNEINQTNRLVSRPLPLIPHASSGSSSSSGPSSPSSSTPSSPSSSGQSDGSDLEFSPGPSKKMVGNIKSENASSSSISSTYSPSKISSPREGANPKRVNHPTKPPALNQLSAVNTSNIVDKSGSSYLSARSTNSARLPSSVDFAHREIYTDQATVQDIAFESYVQYHRELAKLRDPEFLKKATLTTIEQQVRLSHQLLKYAAECGSSEAAFTLANSAMGRLIETPEGNTNQYRENALKYAQQAVALDPKNAQPILDLVVQKITKTAATKNGHACWQLAVLNFHKQTVDAQNVALEYAKLAIKYGYQRAGSELAEMYLNGNVVEKNPTKAIELLDDAIKHKESYGFYVYGKAILDGVIKGSAKKALEYINTAANAEDVSGLVYLGLLYLKGEFVSLDFGKAESHFQLAYGEVMNDEDQALKIASEVFDVYKNKMLDKDVTPEERQPLLEKIEEWAAKAKQHGSKEVEVHIGILKNWKALDS